VAHRRDVEQLTNEWRQWRTAPRDTRRFIEGDIIRDAGVLGHFVGDASNPHHVTVHYKGWAGPNRTAMPSTAARTTVRALLRVATPWPPASRATREGTVMRGDYFAAAAGRSARVELAGEPLYRLDRDGAFALVTPPSAAGRRLRRRAAGGRRVDAARSLVVTWKNSGSRRDAGRPRIARRDRL